MSQEQPPPIPPLEYATPSPKKPSNLFLIIFGLLTSKTTRLIYFLICSAGMFFVIRFLLRYRQMLEDAMKQK